MRRYAFNGKDVSPLEIVQIARAEAESWNVAQTIEQTQEDDTEETPLALLPQEDDRAPSTR
ncbi:hypothetical protein IGI04_034241 [Brassica rapa subsp. trilocularis]|uniref:Uncharacterized protein n=1 Tax=Brassica rapa subsp. trilocularis TaxID=1813537 RepID=A0ABQ7L858_BRACM|nr:hypothetical protein IGI04_034241 [Brassica rapa subsp. trilocularis]